VARYLYVGRGLDRAGEIESDVLPSATERQQLAVEVPALQPLAQPLAQSLRRDDVAGVILQLTAGFLGRRERRVVADVLSLKKEAWLHWPAERAFENVDDERLASLRRHWFGVVIVDRLTRPLVLLGERWSRLRPGLRWIYRGAFPIPRDRVLVHLEQSIVRAKPVPFPPIDLETRPVVPAGLYLRTDFWAQIPSGGSYGHTVYVAKELAATSEKFAALFTQRYDLLSRFGVHQVVMDPPPLQVGEGALVLAPDHYYPIVKAACQLMRPSFIYERLCLGNDVAARLSEELQIPYIVEYNGSELSMQKSFDGTSPFYADLFLKAEEFAFRQATMISVISEPVRDDLVKRGVEAAKILVNPNGADPESYAPPTPEERSSIRSELGFADPDRVVGFTGTFGGWHGVDVLGAAIPRICELAPSARFLLIGDGQHKASLDANVAAHGLADKVRSVGRVTQAEGARLLRACDVFVSPHNSHMVDSRFFGSPTKIFEYMAMGGGIVASRLEQIGDVLAPALTTVELKSGRLGVTDQRSVLVAPGDVDEFVDGVVALVEQPSVAAALGRNARQAVLDHFSWRRHVERVWQFAASRPSRQPRSVVATGDAYKDQVQNQWNNNPVGSEHVESASRHTLDWYLQIEKYRYGTYAPWMPEVMEFARHAGEDVLEIGGGLGIDLAQFALRGARVTDVDLSAGHLAHAEEHFCLRGLKGRFVHHDAETLPLETASFDVVYSNGVIHHTPNTAVVVREISRVLRPGGKAIVMVYAENSLHYWRNLLWAIGLREGEISRHSMGHIMSYAVERTANQARPLVKVYTKERLRRLFSGFEAIEIEQRQMVPDELPARLRRFLPSIERRLGWNLIIKATKPRAGC
jgi:glycosyltransferase involved in cell wall biosynthesis/SAM-dependent methyltransferase